MSYHGRESFLKSIIKIILFWLVLPVILLITGFRNDHLFLYLMCVDSISCCVWIASAIVFDYFSVAARLRLTVSLTGYSTRPFFVE